MWRPIATIAAAVRDVELEEPVLKLCWYFIYINLVLNIFIFLGGGPTLIAYTAGRFGTEIQQICIFKNASARSKYGAVYRSCIRDDSTIL